MKLRPLLRAGSVGVRVPHHRQANFVTGGVGYTWHSVFGVAQAFDAVRVIFFNHQTSGTNTIAACKVSALSDISSAAAVNNSAGDWKTVNFTELGGSTSLTPANPSSVNRPILLLSDEVELHSVEPAAGRFPLVAVRAYFTASVTQHSVVGNGTDDFTNWATRPDGRVWINRRQSGNHVTDPTTFSDTTNISQTPIVGVVYLSRGTVVNVSLIGDSNTDGRGTYLSEGWALKGADMVSRRSGPVVEIANWSYAGQIPLNYAVRGIDLLDTYLAKIKPDVFVYQPFSFNGVTGDLDAVELDTMRLYLARTLAAARRAEVAPILWTGIPVNTATKALGTAGDALRRAWNAELLDLRDRGIDVMDFASIVRGSPDGTGQEQFRPAFTTDGAHPNDLGNQVLAEEFAEVLAPVVESVT